jgi:RNA polymerase sigma-70 factor (ECF subfamily)
MWLFAASTRAGGAEVPRNDARDAAILERLARGDADAVAYLYDRYSRLVFSLVLRILQDDAEAEDVVQDVFVQAWLQAARYSPARGTAPAWLLTMARSRALDRLRARRVRPEGAPAASEHLIESMASPGDLAATVLADEDAALLRRALADLPLLQRVAIELAYFEGLTQREIAERLGEPVGTVKTRIRTGLLKLRHALAVPSMEGA